MIPLSRLRGGKRGKKRDYTKTFAKGFSILYEMPKYGGYGDHWPLSDDEAYTLGSKLNECVHELPKGASNRFFDFMERHIAPWIPFFALGGTVYLVTEPRVAATRQMIKENKARERATNSPDVTPNGSARSNGTVHEGTGDAAPQSDDAKIFHLASERERFARDVRDTGTGGGPTSPVDGGAGGEFSEGGGNE